MDVLLLTTCDPPGRVEKVYGLVTANTVMARGVGRDFLAGLKGLVGGEISEYKELLEQARERALQELREKAREMGANAVICVRFETSDIAQAMAEILVYGTAVRLENTY